MQSNFGLKNIQEMSIYKQKVFINVQNERNQILKVEFVNLNHQNTNENAQSGDLKKKMRYFF